MSELMTKRHFEFIADTVPVLGLTLGQIEALGNRLRTTNHSFKRDIFLERVAKAHDIEERTYMAGRIRRLKLWPYSRYSGGI